MLIEPQDGNWYVVVTCEECESMIVLFRDLTEGKGSLNATYGIACPRCQHEGHYDGRHYRHSSEMSPGK